MSQKELEDVIKELYRLNQLEDTKEDIDFILNQVINKIGE